VRDCFFIQRYEGGKLDTHLTALPFSICTHPGIHAAHKQAYHVVSIALFQLPIVLEKQSPAHRPLTPLGPEREPAYPVINARVAFSNHSVSTESRPAVACEAVTTHSTLLPFTLFTFPANYTQFQSFVSIAYDLEWVNP
jgi:hypothetical protein